ncbi:CBS domain-containing protein [Actinomadura sp. HBU206391]|uniref:CBS domain-containing protein n=1 Tax=Actinomadura sp. HBU206391 TaxID=2731692 RepID=UPI001650C0E0|nr:CBS domain-containing protein [Actinomadura sp. HBU206391]MBC6461801.1 CBS domain-containing protein [Actinomadura sp. HBU206391]
MRAEHLAEQFPCVGLDDQALEAARLIVRHGLSGVVVTDRMRRPCAAVSVYDVLGFVVAPYVYESACLARVYDEASADLSACRLADQRVRGMLSDPPAQASEVSGRATAIELAVAMKRLHTSLIVVQDSGRACGAVGPVQLLTRLLAVA